MFILRVASFSVFVSAETLDGISLLQTQARVHSTELPEPKRQSSITTDVELSLGENIDFQCKKGKGKWYQTTSYATYGEAKVEPKYIRAIGWEDDVGNDYKTNQRTHCDKAIKDPDGGTQAVDLGPVKDEVDCFNRAIRDIHAYHSMGLQRCGWWPPLKNYGVWYNPYGIHGKPIGGVNGACFVGGVAAWKYQGGTMGNIHLIKAPNATTVEWGKGIWFCQLEDKDMAKIKSPKEPKEPKEKKTKEEREKCRASKADKANKREIWKGLRAEVKAARSALKSLIAEAKAAKKEYLDAKATKQADC